MQIITVKDKRVKAIVERPNLTSVKGLDAREFRKISEMVAAIRTADHPRALQAVPSWKAHELKPGKPGVWSLTVTGNWRLTFLFKPEGAEVHFLDYEDYH